MTDYVFEVMKQFPESFINYKNELILIPKTNLYVGLYNVNTPTDLKFKLLELCSRDCTYASWYSQEWRNRRYQDDVLSKINKCLGTNFTREEMELVYERLGNGCDHKLTERFVNSGYDIEVLKGEL